MREESFVLVSFQWSEQRVRGGAAAIQSSKPIYVASEPKWQRLSADGYLQLLKSLY